MNRETVNNNKSADDILQQMTGLYQKDPRKFEKMRAMLIERTIATFPASHQQRAYGLQFVIEMRLRKYKDPVARMNKMVEIFWQQFGQFQGVLQDPVRVVAERKKNKKQAMIMPFGKGGEMC